MKFIVIDTGNLVPLQSLIFLNIFFIYLYVDKCDIITFLISENYLNAIC